MSSKQSVRVLSGVVVILSFTATAFADSVLFDFETGAQGWRSFGAITTDSTFSSGSVSGSVGLGYFHTGDFDNPDEGNFGMVDVSPTTGPLRDLSAFQGLSVDALFKDVPGFPSYAGVKELSIVVATGFAAGEEEFFAAPVLMTDTFQTFSVAFADFQSTLTFLPPSISDLSDATIKLVMYNVNGTGTGELVYDQITGLDSIASANNADFDGDLDVDGRDFLIWQENFGTGTMLSQGDANQSGTVDSLDLDIWQAQYGNPANTLSVAATAVPEPTFMGICSMATVLMTAARFRC